MSMQTAGDIPVQVTSENSSSERRITPSWTIGHLKAKLEPVTGIPPPCQKLTLRVANQQGIPIEAADEENTQLSNFPLAPYAELHVSVPVAQSTRSRASHSVFLACFFFPLPPAFVRNVF
jgi:tubulin-specific chaperone B